MIAIRFTPLTPTRFSGVLRGKMIVDGPISSILGDASRRSGGRAPSYYYGYTDPRAETV
jgi:hypothetical protein